MTLPVSRIREKDQTLEIVNSNKITICLTLSSFFFFLLISFLFLLFFYDTQNPFKNFNPTYKPSQ